MEISKGSINYIIDPKNTCNFIYKIGSKKGLKCTESIYESTSNGYNQYCKLHNLQNYCYHGNNAYYCIECKKSPYHLCFHKKNDGRCKVCIKLCQHNKMKSKCNVCKVYNKLCVHKNIKYYCIVCPGKGICEHLKVRSKCKYCNGASVCIHSRQKIICKECHGNAICEHNNVKYNCNICNLK